MKLDTTIFLPTVNHQQMTRNPSANSQASQVSIVFLSSSLKPALAAPQCYPMELQYLPTNSETVPFFAKTVSNSFNGRKPWGILTYLLVYPRITHELLHIEHYTHGMLFSFMFTFYHYNMSDMSCVIQRCDSAMTTWRIISYTWSSLSPVRTVVVKIKFLCTRVEEKFSRIVQFFHDIFNEEVTTWISRRRIGIQHVLEVSFFSGKEKHESKEVAFICIW